RLKQLPAWAAVLTVALVFACEKPVAVTGPVSNIAQFVVSPKNVTLQPNQTQDFIAVGLTATGDSADVSVTWTATGASARGSSSGKLHYGHYQNANCGSFQVVATSNPGNLSDNASVTVTGCTVPVASVSVTPASATISAGQSAQLTATPQDANGNPLSGRTVTWSSSNPSVAVADVNGKVTGVAAGSATITATSEGQSGTATVTVTGPAPGCATSTTAFQNSAFTSQNGSFTATFDATPNGAGLDAATGLSSGPAAAYTDMAVIL